MGGGGGRGKKQARDFFAGLDGLFGGGGVVAVGEGLGGGLVWVAACR